MEIQRLNRRAVIHAVDATALCRGASRWSLHKDVSSRSDATALCRGVSRWSATQDVSYTSGCHGLVPWISRWLLQKDVHRTLQMPRPCAVVVSRWLLQNDVSHNLLQDATALCRGVSRWSLHKRCVPMQSVFESRKIMPWLSKNINQWTFISPTVIMLTCSGALIAAAPASRSRNLACQFSQNWRLPTAYKSLNARAVRLTWACSSALSPRSRSPHVPAS